MNRHQDVFILKTDTMTPQEINLFYTSAKIIFEGSCGTMEEQHNAAAPKPVVDPLEKPVETEKNSEVSGYRRGKKKKPLAIEQQAEEKAENLQFYNGFGGFKKQGRSYVLKLEKNILTPAPWVNIITNPNFGFMVSESGGGYTWCENSRENKISKWSNDPIGDEPGEVFYIGDETGAQWSLTPLPIREDEPYTIEHGFGYSSFRHISHGIEQELIQFVSVFERIKIDRKSVV